MHLPRRAALYESRREREFYRYYEPIRSLTESGPPLCNLTDEQSVRDHRPFSSPDRALTAFCQLGALRLGVRRAMLFFFDSQYAYVLAEATRTLSLQDDSVHEIEDKLWLGHSIIPRGYSICEETVCKLSEPEDQTASESNHDMIHIINDLEQDTQFCDRPFVTHGPKARFYAGVPITTPNGINIGAYCCLDDKTHPQGLDEKGVNFLKDMSTTIMTHLSHVRAKSEHHRGTQMIAGLGAFIEGAPSLRSWEEESYRRDRKKMGKAESVSPAASRPPLLNPEASSSSPSPAPDDRTSFSPRRHSNEGSKKTVSADSVPTVSDFSGETGPTSTSDSGNTSLPKTAKTTRHAEDLREQLVASNVRSAFSRAATVVREAVDVDGCVFLDATVGTYGGLVEPHTGSDLGSDAVTSGGDLTGTDGEGHRRIEGKDKPDNVCHVLASSHTSQDPYSSSGELQRVANQTTITEKFLRSILRRYPHGKIWNFNEEGDASSDDESSESSVVTDQRPDTPKTSQSEVSETSQTRRPGLRRRRARIDDGREIQRLFPGVRSLALVGMWDQSRGRWYAACAVWTYSPLRLFSQESEVAYLSAFNDVAIAEVHRIEAQNSDSAKSDFISSISHELRSPLHGILGSVECLQDQDSDSFTAALISQIEICGRTLLDIVDHLLDFSKINQISKHQVGSSGDGQRRKLAPPSAGASHLGGILAQDSDVSLDEITEEVVETAVYSFCCSRDKQTILERKVAVAIDIARPSDGNWKCRLPVGGWKRICINLVSNALKYTAEGFIHVSLKAEPIPGKRRRCNAVFTVSDSGKGMSREFLENHLFRAFSQEDTLMEGTGLGMSLVAKIIKAMGGKIEVQSEKGTGTTMIVTVPIDRSRPDRNDRFSQHRRALEGTTLGILGFEEVAEASTGNAHQQARTYLHKNIGDCCAGLGLRSRRADWSLEPQSDIYLIAERDLGLYQERLRSRRTETASESRKPIIILCDSAISARQLRAGTAALGFTPADAEFIAQPCGPDRLATAVKACLSRFQEEITTTDVQTSTTAGAVSEIANLAQWLSPLSLHGGEPQTLPIRIEDRDEDTSSPEADKGHIKNGKPVRPAEEEPERLSTYRQRLSPTEENNTTNRAKSVGSRPHSPLPVDPLTLKRPSVPRKVSHGPKDGLSLLLVDDNQINLQLLVNYARKQGHHRTTATDGQEAVEAYKAAYFAALRSPPQETSNVSSPSAETPSLPGKPQVVLMDINMPVLNGFEATRLIRAFEQQHGLHPAHIIALTGLGTASAQHEAFSSGVDLFLTKPVRLKELSRVLEEVRKTEMERATPQLGTINDGAS
ncbi:hypothetical protein KC357_g880 [Hortaea werneckii]|nr:hypothetical protein KC357_g880 [Hortaea werneckii]